MEEIDIKVEHIKKEADSSPKIKVIGVGGGGTNAVANLASEGCREDIDLIVANTDLIHLNSIEEPRIKKIQLGKDLCKGLG